MDPIDFIHALDWRALPMEVQHQAKRCVLDLIGVAAGALETDLSGMIRAHAAQTFGGSMPMLFDARTASPAGVALAAGMTIDALDGHDGFNPAKGHIGCPLFPAALALARQSGASGAEFLAAMAMGYEFGARASVAQHATVLDYHTSGSWGAVTAAAAGARLVRLDREQTRHALGIAEYHGPRSQMMRCIDHPTMLKDGSGWGAYGRCLGGASGGKGVYRRAGDHGGGRARTLARSRRGLADHAAIFQALSGLPLGAGPGGGRADAGTFARPDRRRCGTDRGGELLRGRSPCHQPPRPRPKRRNTQRPSLVPSRWSKAQSPRRICKAMC